MRKGTNKTKLMDILKFIEITRNSDRYVKDIYTKGGCYQFARILESLFSGGEVVINNDKDHAAYDFAGAFWDINGVSNEKYDTPTEIELELMESWSFWKTAYLKAGECPVCEEPLLIKQS